MSYLAPRLIISARAEVNLVPRAHVPFGQHQDTERALDLESLWNILVPRGRASFGQHQESRPLRSNNGSPRFTDFPSLCACSESSLTNLIGSGQGRGRRLLKFKYLDHPTKSDVTSGSNLAAQLVSQSEKMAFRSAKIFFYLQPIRFVSFQTEGGKMLQAHSFDFETKTFG